MSASGGAGDLRERSIGEIAGALTRDLSLLVRKELELAAAEMRQKGRMAVPVAGLFGAAGAFALLAVGTLTAALVLALALFLDAWLAALVAGLGLGAVATGLWLAGKARVEEMGSPLPEQTIETIKEDVEWVKTQARSGRR